MDNYSKNYVLIKVPLKIENKEKASNLLGNTKDLYTKIKNGENLSFNFFYNNLTLENCFSNDILLQRKTLRNKKDKTKFKYQYKVLGKISNNIQSFSMEDFIFVNENKSNIDNLKNYIVSKEEYENEIRDKKDKNIPLTEELLIMEKLIKNKKQKIGDTTEDESENIAKYFPMIQPINFSNLRNSMQKVPGAMKDKIKFDELKEL